ncbi:MAG: MotA/TolQ/ExbB proton channel family protein [Acidobacteria bacterium]|nr:MotA/TolQ/ExbB proton channel family protein [Acidobacteriota bacterium]
MPANILVTLGQPVAARGNISIIELILSASPAVQLVLILLIGMSVATWGIIFLKSQTFRRAALESQDIRHEMDQEGASLADLRDLVDEFRDAPEAGLIRDGFDLWTRLRTPSTADRVRMVGNAIERTTRQEVIRLERHLTLLATTGSAAPFIGLFGTVWGIMNTFAALGSSGSTSLSVVAPGIAEALVATAVGLAAAIPAVMAYNHYVQRVRIVASDMETFASEFIDRLEQSARS